MRAITVNRTRLLDALDRTIATLERQSAEADHPVAVLAAPMGVADSTAGDAMTGVLEDARDFMERDTAAAETTDEVFAMRIASFSNEPYIPSHKGLSLFQSALDEFLETNAISDAEFDPTDPKWLSVAWEKIKTFFRGKHTFVKHSSPNDFVETLQDNARIALVADWGTGTDHAERVMHQIAAVHPSHVIHLGDVYYSGTKREIETRFLRPIREFGPSAPCIYRALNSNHEMYSGGEGYFELTLPTFGQAASYFNLRGTNWQVIGLDSGHEDHGLREPQEDWLRAQLDGATGRRTVLLSHHQPFSAFDERPEGKKLGKKIAPFLPQIFGWIFGHEHRCIVYGPHLGIHARCIGHGAIPYRVPFGSPAGPPVVFADQRPDPHDGSIGIHGFALMELDGSTIRMQYIDEFGNTIHQETLG